MSARSIIFNGHDFSSITTAVVADVSALPADLEIASAAGAAKSVLLNRTATPRVLRATLYLDGLADADILELETARRQVRKWLLAPEGAELVVPASPEITYRDVVVASAGAWSSNGADGACEVVFWALDPVGYGQRVSASAATVEVGGTYRTWPILRLRARAGSYLRVRDTLGGGFVELERSFADGDTVVVDMEAGRASVNGTSATADVTLESDFFCLAPPRASISVTGAELVSLEFFERWV